MTMIRIQTRNLRAVLAGLASTAALLVANAAASAQTTRTQLKVYSTLEADNIAPYKQAFEAANPDIEIVWIRDSTGVVTAKIMAEGDNQHGDAIWGLDQEFVGALPLLLPRLEALARTPAQRAALATLRTRSATEPTAWARRTS